MFICLKFDKQTCHVDAKWIVWCSSPPLQSMLIHSRTGLLMPMSGFGLKTHFNHAELRSDSVTQWLLKSAGVMLHQAARVRMLTSLDSG